MPSKVERKLAAIMFTDIAGYTEQMSKDEDKAFALIQKKRELLLPLLKKFNGDLIKEIGDGTLTRYFKPDNAVACASSFQSKTDTDLKVRAGIHTGEVIIDKEDVFGDVVNVASRLESIAAPGSVFVSKETIDKLELTDKVEFVSIGMQSLKGVGRLIEVYAVKDEGLVIPNPDNYKDTLVDVDKDDKIPSVAILPFKNQGPKEEDFYIFGLTSEIISSLTKEGEIKVPSINQVQNIDSSKNLDEIAKKLQVRYLLESSIFKKGDKFQLSSNLYDTKKSRVVWNDNWNDSWENISVINNKISDSVLKLIGAESNIFESSEIYDPKAYEMYLKAKALYYTRRDKKEVDEVRKLVSDALEKDDTLIAARTLLGFSYFQMGQYKEAEKIYNDCYEIAVREKNQYLLAQAYVQLGNISFNKADFDRCQTNAQKALEINREINNVEGIALSLNLLGLAMIKKNIYDQAIDHFEESFTIRQKLDDKLNMALLKNNIGIMHLFLSEYNKSLECHNQAYKISSSINDNLGISRALTNKANVHFKQLDLLSALDCCKEALDIKKNLGDETGSSILISNMGQIYRHLGDYDQSKKLISKALSAQNSLEEKHNIFDSTLELANTLMYTNSNRLNSLFEDASNLISEIGDKKGLSELHFVKGIYFTRAKEYEKSSINFERSIKFLERFETKDGLIERYAYFINTLKELGRDCKSQVKILSDLLVEATEINEDACYMVFLALKDHNQDLAYEYLTKAKEDVKKISSQIEDDRVLSLYLEKDIVKKIKATDISSNESSKDKEHSSGSDDIASQLEKLSSLHKMGVLTDEEFASAKTKLISKM